MSKKELIEKRGKLILDAQALANSSDFDNTANEQYTKMMDSARDIKIQIDAISNADSMAAALEQEVDVKRRAGCEDTSDGAPQQQGNAGGGIYNVAMAKFLRGGRDALDSDEAVALQNGFSSLPQGAASSGVGTEGGYTIPDAMMGSIEVAELEYNGLIEAGADVLETDGGNDIPWPTMDDTGSEGEIVGENVEVPNGDLTFGTVKLGAHLYSSTMFKVPFALLQDSGVDIETLIANACGERIGRRQGRDFTLGDGVAAPKGFITSAPVGLVGGAAAVVTFEELQDLKHSVKNPYRKVGTFMFNDNSFNAIVKMKDGENRPLFLPSMRDGEPDRLLGRPYVINDYMADMAADAKSLAFGDFSKYKIRRVRGGQLLRLTERFAEKGQVAFLLFRRADGGLIDAGTGPVKVLQQAA